MINEIILLVVLLLLSGFFSSAETAMFSISNTKIRYLAKEGRNTDILIERMKNDSHRLLTTILIGNNVVNVGASALATAVAMKLAPSYAIGVATGVMTFLILVFGEVFPKSIATRNNILIARLTIYPVYWLSILFYPILLFLNFIPRLTGKIKRTPVATEKELMTFVDVVEEEGEIKEEERNLIYNVFEFDDTSASEIMTPRADMFVINAGKPLDLEDISRSGFTRVPVIDGDIDHVVGIINIKDLFGLQAVGRDEIDIRKVMRDPYFIPENKKLDTLLTQFKKQRSHLAIVVDEHGGVSGLISLEDVIEELVGEISDESDKEEPHIIKIKSNEWLVLGKSDIEEVNLKISMDIPDSPEYDTFSGYILDRIGLIPVEKEVIELDRFEVVVKMVRGNRIEEYLVRKK